MGYKIYTLHLKTEPEKVMYIGQTKKPLNIRLSNHLSAARTTRRYSKAKVYEWIRNNQYNIGIKLLVEIPTKEDADIAEVWYIKIYRENGCDLVNTTEGADQSTLLYYDKNGNAKKVLQYTLEGEFVAVHECMRAGAEKAGTRPELISGCVNRSVIKSAGGYIWIKYKDGYSQKINPYKRIVSQVNVDQSYIIYQYNENRVLVQIYNSLHTVEKSTGISRQAVAYACKNKTLLSNNYWAFSPIDFTNVEIYKVANNSKSKWRYRESK